MSYASMKQDIKSAAFPDPFKTRTGRFFFRTWKTVSIVCKSPSTTIVKTGTLHSTAK